MGRREEDIDDKTKEQRIAEIRARINQSPIKDEDGREGVLVSCTLADGRQVGTRAWGDATDWFVDLAINHVAHTVLHREEVLEGGAA
ncbi:hypothetical protein [Paracoccus sp. S3-43]|uniref:hypothetical protein n=1 Tax=Paracoccus sp. S3-43 TaxID=3030011 RepID=UPI0023B1A33A|nr:hypothetical protein [Paracoccus sp. S3-43]WEF25845.1 hypothetical protein PXD02_08050 [Paracoccus sp. S3-43]